MKSKILSPLLHIILFLSLFILIQALSQLIVQAAAGFINGSPKPTAEIIAIASVFSSLLTIFIFARTRWTPISNHYLKTKPWGVAIWTTLLAIGTILPTQFIFEKIQLTMPDSYTQLFEAILRTPWGYAALGILVPVAEEIVFRGAILRTLLNLTGHKRRWLAITLSALLFGAIHLNLAQGIHAFIIGIPLGWAYCRTKSIIPGILIHWVNNTIAYIMFHLMPHMADGKLIDLFHGSSQLMYGGLFFSLCILIPSVFQLNMRMKAQ